MASNTNQKLEIIKNSLSSIGYSVEEAENQIQEVGKLVIMAILHRLIQEKANVQLKNLTPQNIKKFLEENFNANYLRLVIQEESNNLIENYLNEITQDLPAGKKDSFFRQIQE